ncbi:MAG: ABC transporter permease [Bacteroidota bacterium]|nr:ABC transporter permease [Bacteroidota bacterium]MDP4218559.1 ABC transporter permease [Bacteroidota bacterium]MDP4245984.1 ABC transporter permease [Bacteroidota bacterium]
MFRHYFKIAWRSLLKARQFTFLNLVGLSTGLACTLFILLWVNDELHVDQFNEKDSQLFQVMQNWETPQGVETNENTPGPLASTLAAEMPEVAYSVPVIPATWSDKKGVLTYGDSHVEASQQFVGKDFLRVFTYPLRQGNKEDALSNKNSILLSEELARKLFPMTEHIVGKTVSWNQKDYSGVYVISGVFAPLPLHATAQFDMLFNYDLFLEKNPKKVDNWGNNDPATYVILKKGTDVSSFNKKIANLLKARDPNSKQTLFLQKYSDRYLHNHYENGVPSGGRIEYVRLFSIIALFILVIACINFMNLSTAKAVGRMKEAGVKKVMGASRSSLVLQYLGESTLMAGLALLIAVIPVILLLGRFNEITGKHLRIHFDAGLISLVLGITLLTGIISGTYPALYLSGFRPAVTLKGRLKNSVGELLVRKGLVIFQFALSGLFIVSVMVIYRQMQMIQTRNLGYTRDHVIYFDKGGMLSDDKNDYAPGGKYESGLERFMEEVRQTSGVVNAANFRHNITNREGGTSDLSWPGKDPGINMTFTDLGVGYHFIETMGIQMVAGRTFSRDYGSERSKIIFNELAIERMGLKDPIGKIVHLWGEDREIIGVAKNFHFQSLYEDLKPCFFDLTVNQRASKIMVRIQAGQESQTIDRLERLYKKNNPGFAFEYKFLDADYQALYSSERRVAVLSKYFAGLAIIISCLGLFGLAAFTAQRRKKEIGIRKVVGATAGHIVVMLSTDFMKLILAALLIAFPLSWLVMSQWLHDFAFCVNIGAVTFLTAGGLIILITALTISFQAIQAATANPAKSLKTE